MEILVDTASGRSDETNVNREAGDLSFHHRGDPSQQSHGPVLHSEVVSQQHGRRWTGTSQILELANFRLPLSNRRMTALTRRF